VSKVKSVISGETGKIVFWKVIAIASLFSLVVSTAMLLNVRSYNSKVQQVFEKSITENINIIKSLKVINPNNLQCYSTQECLQSQAVNVQFSVATDDITKNLIKEKQEIAYKDFMEKYYEVQSNWLNTWLTILAIILGLMAIVIPILFLKFNEKQEEKLSKALDDVGKLDDIIDKKVKNYSEKSIKDLEEMKAYVNESKANALVSSAQNKIREGSYTDAENIINQAISLKESKEAHWGLAHIYNQRKEYESLIKELELIVEKYGEDISSLVYLGVAYGHTINLEAAITNTEKAIALLKRNAPGDKRSLSTCYYNLTEFYLRKKDAIKALEYLNLFKDSAPSLYLFNDDEELWKNSISSLPESDDKAKINELVAKLPIVARGANN